MIKWDTKKIVDALKKNSSTGTQVTISDSPGGDYDTNEIKITRDDARIEIVGFRDLGGNCIEQSEWDVADVDWIFCCESSKNGMINAKPADLRLCADVLEILESIGYNSVSNEGWDRCI